jgi:glycosyltransferase involved in cell wall biosynthesis
VPTLITVVIPVFNGGELIRRCLESVCAQNLERNTTLEIIVIDDGSTDDTIEIVKQFGASVTMLTQVHQGPAAARNIGIAHSKGDYLALLDADDYWKPDFIRETLTFMRENPVAIGVSTGQIHKFLNKEEKIAPVFLMHTPSIKKGILIEDFFSFWAQHNHICTGSTLISMQVIRQAGGQLEDLRLSQDLEFWAYLATFGSWGFLPRVLFVSDGDKVTRKLGWWEKKKERWFKAPDIEAWERRIIKRLPDPLPESYLKCRARVAINLSYAALLSNRLEIGRQMVTASRAYLPNDRLSKLLAAASTNRLFWWLLAKLLVFREKRRKI